jgi:hypothetical protein
MASAKCECKTISGKTIDLKSAWIVIQKESFYEPEIAAGA